MHSHIQLTIDSPTQPHTQSCTHYTRCEDVAPSRDRARIHHSDQPTQTGHLSPPPKPGHLALTPPHSTPLHPTPPHSSMADPNATTGFTDYQNTTQPHTTKTHKTSLHISTQRHAIIISRIIRLATWLSLFVSHPPMVLLTSLESLNAIPY